MTSLTHVQMRAWLGLLRTHRALFDQLDAELIEACDLPLTWYEALVQLNEAGGTLRMHAFADALSLSRSATTRFVDRMERNGLVVRRLCEDDRRGMEVCLSAEGEAKLAAASPVHLDGVQRLFAEHLRPEQTEVLAKAFEAILEAARS